MTSSTAPSTAFTDELWHSIEPIYAAILRHPFIAGLTDGSLPRKSFEFYAVQDALYLREFARSLAIAAAHAPKDDWIVMLSDHASGSETRFVLIGFHLTLVRQIVHDRWIVAIGKGAGRAPRRSAISACCRARISAALSPGAGLSRSISSRIGGGRSSTGTPWTSAHFST